MNIRPRNIPKFDGGGSTFDLLDWINKNTNYYNWYSSIYPNALKLMGNPLQLRNDNWNRSLLSSSHYTTDDLRRSAYNNYLYTNDYNAREEDLIHWAESLSDFGTISDRDFVNRYNTQALSIRDAREAPQTYNTSGYSGTNRTFRNMFYNRSRLGTDTPLYTIGYLENLDDIEGTSTWQRRMDRYEKKFVDDTLENLKNRVFYITRPDGTKIKVYKKDNGDIGLFSELDSTLLLKIDSSTPVDPESKKQQGIPEQHQERYGFDWSKLGKTIGKTLNNPDLLAAGRLAGNLINNGRVYDEALKGIKPDLINPYHTYRQVVGDEATKLAYYTRAAKGQTRAARPFTSDADRQMAYMMEAKRVGDELRTQGDLADNQEIRRTSDESNQHQWANVQRDTEVGNANRASINKANSLRLNLLALKQAALWSSIDNFLQGIEYRKRQTKEKLDLLADLIWLLESQNLLENNPLYLELTKKANDAWDKAEKAGKTPSTDEAVKKALLDLRNWKTRWQIQSLQTRPAYAKSGTKITYKKKDDLLYKSAKDIVEHFLRMSKISSDAQNRKQIKIQKLASHPKGSTKKYLLGGVAPFTVYKPVAVGGETTISSQAENTSTSKKGSEKNETLDMVKELFKTVAGKGLPSDVNSLYSSMSNFLSRAQAFGTELSTEDIASMYLSQMLKLNQIQYLKANYDKAQTVALNNDALNEIAVNSAGRIAVQNRETGDIAFVNSISDIEEGFTPLTNLLILNLRAMNPNFASRTDLDEIVANGVGMSKIADFLKSQLPKIGSTENTIEGFTRLDSNNIKAGLELLKDAPAGDYKMTQYTKTLQEQAKLALNYLASILPRNMAAVLKANADMRGITPDQILQTMVGSTISEVSKIEFDAVTGKAAKDSNGKSLESDIKSNFLILVLKDQIGVPRKFSMITRDGNSELYSLNSKYISQLPNVLEDMSIDKMLGESKIGSILDSNLGITFGDQVISPENLKDIMFDKSGGATIVTLPCRWENGHKVVNFEIKDKFDEAVKEAGQIVPINYLDSQFNKILSLKLKEKNLNSLIQGDSLDPDMFGHFMVVSAYTTDKIKLNNFNSRYIEKVNNPDKALEERLIHGLSTNKDKNNYEVDVDDTWGWFEGTWDDVYRGNVFIPINNDPISAQTGWGNDNIKLDEAQELANQYQIWNKMGKAKSTDSSLL